MKAIWNGEVIAESNETVVVENNHYFPRSAVKSEIIQPSATQSVCPWKGMASYFSLKVNNKENKDAAWYYADPKPAAEKIKDHIAFWKGVRIEP